MSAGDLENIQSFAGQIRQNVKAMLDHGNQTRKELRELQAEVEKVKAEKREQDKQIQELRKLLVNVQTKVFSGGT